LPVQTSYPALAKIYAGANYSSLITHVSDVSNNPCCKNTTGNPFLISEPFD